MQLVDEIKKWLNPPPEKTIEQQTAYYETEADKLMKLADAKEKYARARQRLDGKSPAKFKFFTPGKIVTLLIILVIITLLAVKCSSG